MLSYEEITARNFERNITVRSSGAYYRKFIKIFKAKHSNLTKKNVQHIESK